MIDTGVYRILNLIDNKVYIGSASVSLKKRINSHKRGLAKNKHSNIYLQNAYNKYGATNFIFEPIELCAPENCITKEQYYIDKFESYKRKLGYNISPVAGSVLGIKWSKKSKKKLSKTVKTYWKNLSDSERLRISKIRKSVVVTEETKLKIKISSTGRKHTSKTKRKMRLVQAKLAYLKKTKQHRDKLKAAWVKRKEKGISQKEIEGYKKTASKNKGKKRSKEFCEEISKRFKGVPKSQEQKVKIATKLLGTKQSEQTKRKISKALKGRKLTPKQRLIYVEAWARRRNK